MMNEICSLQVVCVSCSSPSWINYLDYLNSLILSGIKATCLISMKNMFVAMSSSNNNEVLSIVLQLNDCQLTFEPSLVPLTSQFTLQEILNHWIDEFIHRGDLIDPLGEKKSQQFSSIIDQDPLINELREKIRSLVQETCEESLKLIEAFSQYSFLYQLPVNQSFQLFLNGDRRVQSSTPKNFLSEQDAGRKSVTLTTFLLFLCSISQD